MIGGGGGEVQRPVADPDRDVRPARLALEHPVGQGAYPEVGLVGSGNPALRHESVAFFTQDHA